MMKVTGSRNNPVEIELVADLLDEAAAQDYNLYSKILTVILKKVPRADLNYILETYEDTVYGSDDEEE